MDCRSLHGQLLKKLLRGAMEHGLKTVEVYVKGPWDPAEKLLSEHLRQQVLRSL